MLDDVLQGESKIDVIKMDIEGSEARALQRDDISDSEAPSSDIYRVLSSASGEQIPCYPRGLSWQSPVFGLRPVHSSSEWRENSSTSNVRTDHDLLATGCRWGVPRSGGLSTFVVLTGLPNNVCERCPARIAKRGEDGPACAPSSHRQRDHLLAPSTYLTAPSMSPFCALTQVPVRSIAPPIPLWGTFYP